MAFWLRGSPWPGRILCIVAIMFVALALRLYGLDRQSLWIDEALTITLSNWSYTNLLLYPVDPTPGLYYMLHKALIPSSASLVVMRAIPLVAGVAALPLIYALGRTLFGGRVGWIAAALLAVWPYHVFHSRDARAYTLLFALTLCASLGVALYAKAWLGKPQAGRALRLWALAIYAVGAVLSFYTHMTAVFWIAGTALLLVLTAILARRREAWIEVIVCGAVMALCAAPGLYRLYIEIITLDSFNWLVQATPGEFVRLSLKVLLPRPAYNSLLGADIPRLVVVAALAILTLLALRRVPRRLGVDMVVPALLVLGYLAVPFAIWGFGFVSTPIFIERTILYAIPGVILLIALVIDRSGPLTGLIATIAFMVMWGAPTALKPSLPRQDWRAAAKVITDQAKPGDVVVLCPVWEYAAIRAALPRPVDVRFVMVLYTGALQEIEPRLGADPHWDRVYHQKIDAPDAEARLHRRLEAKTQFPPQQSIPLTTGVTVWEVESTCRQGDRASRDSVLPSVVGPPVRVWEDPYKTKFGGISIFKRSVTGRGEIPAHVAPSTVPN